MYVDTLIGRRVTVTTQTFLTIRCGKCGACHTIHAEPWLKTRRCTVCRRVMQLAEAVEYPPNVVPLRRPA